MVTCKSCQTKNSLDSRFCRNCGVGLPEDEIKVEREQLDLLLAEGYKKLSAGETEEAALIASAAIVSDPSSASAMSLLAMTHERRGEMAEALECYERVLEINPDSALDKIRITQLRTTLAAHAKAKPAPDRRTALVGALAAVIFVSCLGGAIAMMNQGKPSGTVASKETASANQMLEEGFTNPNVAAANPNAANNAAGNQGTQPPNNNPNNAGNGAAGNNSSAPGPIASNPGNRLPDISVPPVRIEPTGPINPNPTGNQNNTTGNQGNGSNSTNTSGGNRGNDGIDPKIDDGSKPAEPAKPKDDPGVIEIKRSGGGGPNLGGSTDVDRPNDSANLLKQAREQFQLGRFDGAASLYERAVKNGASGGSVHQRFGQCYEKLGRKADAIASYNRAVQAYEASQNAAGLESCRQALKILQGSE